MDLGGTYADREIDAAFRKASAGDFKERCLPACSVSREVRGRLSRRRVSWFGVAGGGCGIGVVGDLLLLLMLSLSLLLVLVLV